jgi:beta-fructofuranosidase
VLYSQQYRIWDFWATTDGPNHHLFYLKAPRTGLPQSRHDQALIGHAVSRDWQHWEIHPDALHPAPPAAWDDLSLWTGSVIRAGSQWLMFYTGRDKRTRTQNLGFAISDDLETFRRVKSEPLLQPDALWYATGAEEPPDVFTWRGRSPRWWYFSRIASSWRRSLAPKREERRRASRRAAALA